jgi:hypothetical protein
MQPGVMSITVIFMAWMLNTALSVACPVSPSRSPWWVTSIWCSPSCFTAIE